MSLSCPFLPLHWFIHPFPSGQCHPAVYRVAAGPPKVIRDVLIAGGAWETDREHHGVVLSALRASLWVGPEGPTTAVLIMVTEPCVWPLSFSAPLLTLEIRSLRLLFLCVTETKWHVPPSKVLSSYKERGLQKDGGCKDSPNKLSHVSLVIMN